MTEKWIDSLKSISDQGSVGSCPFCGSTNTDYKCSVVIPENRNGYMDIWCNNCKKAFHVSRMQIPKNMKTEGEIPQGLEYYN